MGRNRKEVAVDVVKMEAMSISEKLQLMDDCNQLFHHELSKIPYIELIVTDKRKAESVAEEYYRGRGFQAYRSRVKDGYRSIGVEFYWKQYQGKITESDRELIGLLRNILSAEEFEELAMMVQAKNGTPDLLLIKDQKISFVEVKPEDMAHFKALTAGHTVVMGRKTWESLPPRFRPLPGRRNIVISRQTDYPAPGAELADSLENALKLASTATVVFIIGGEQIYRQAIAVADPLEITEVDLEPEGDTWFPEIAAVDWEKTGKTE